MYITQCVLALLVLYLGLAHSFSWEIVISRENALEFFDINGTKTHAENVTSSVFSKITYDPVHDRVLFATRRHIFSYEIATKKIVPLVTNTSRTITSFNYDPVSETLFWNERLENIYSISLKPEFNNKTNEKRLVLSHHGILTIEVDSCGGYIYWIQRYKISCMKRARLDGSNEEIVIENFHANNFKIDQHTQKIFWFNKEMEKNIMVTALTYYTYTGHLKYADLNGNNITTIYSYPQHSSSKLAVSKDFIYWKIKDSFWKIPKNSPRDLDVQPTFFMKYEYHGYFWEIVTHYNIEDLTRGAQKCEALTNRLLNSTATNSSSDVSLLCVHGTKVSGESRCECTQGYSGETCDVSMCHNFCFQGNCSISAEGQPECRCNAGYTGERCEVSACHAYCLNSGLCTLNESSEPVCQCPGDHAGERCEVPNNIKKEI